MTRKNVELSAYHHQRRNSAEVVSAAASPVIHIAIVSATEVRIFVQSDPAINPSAIKMNGVENVQVRYRPHIIRTPASPAVVRPAAGWPGGISTMLSVNPEVSPV